VINNSSTLGLMFSFATRDVGLISSVIDLGCATTGRFPATRSAPQKLSSTTPQPQHPYLSTAVNITTLLIYISFAFPTRIHDVTWPLGLEAYQGSTTTRRGALTTFIDLPLVVKLPFCLSRRQCLIAANHDQDFDRRAELPDPDCVVFWLSGRDTIGKVKQRWRRRCRNIFLR
jgi:hypothetical protein